MSRLRGVAAPIREGEEPSEVACPGSPRSWSTRTLRAALTVYENNELRAEVRAVLEEALDLAPADRRAFIVERLPAGESLEDALSLLGEVEDLGTFLESPVGPPSKEPFEPILPERIGSYRVKRILGWGSMGVVYLAEQEAPSRPVAVKVLRVDVSSPTMARRFAQEGELLARLSHPGIASIFEAGVADFGAGAQPYLAMEYVDGVPITKYAAEHDLDRRERVALVVRVARAVAHAHAHGILHRDLKPDNVLVTEEGDPFVLDFGVAHTANAGEDDLTLTATGQVIGTLAYMAPEQARGSELDERADLFALGAILYELLTGELPFDVRGRLPHEALRIVADGDWRPPTVHDRTLAGDVLAMLATALAPEPVHRYGDVGSFAEDLDRWLDGKAVFARPPSTFQELRRFVHRHRTLSVATAVLLVALGAGLSWGTRAANHLHRQESVSVLLSDRQLLLDLEGGRDNLWPTASSTLPAFEDWLERARTLLGQLSRHREALDRLKRESGALTSAGADLGFRWLLGDAAEFMDSIKPFRRETVPEMERRRDVAEGMHAATVTSRRADWERAAERVAADPRFGGLVLVPQEGLVPLGPDPDSGLEEFALWSTGAVPRRDRDTSFRAVLGDAIVLVLIPGGEVQIGSPPAGGDEDVPERTPFEGPPVPIDLAPYLISKNEMTQDQWQRLFGFNPSEWETGSSVEGRTVTGLHPVESMSWEQFLVYLPRVGLTLPTEAQWEHAARAESPFRSLAGRGWRSLIGRVSWNTHDARVLPEGVSLESDGSIIHLPVASFPPNGYGLCDVLGNVWEFCLDTYKLHYHTLEHRKGDGLVLAEPDGDVSRRGLAWGSSPAAFEVYVRGMKRFDGRDATTGVRPARELVLEDSSDSRPIAGPSIDPSHD